MLNTDNIIQPFAGIFVYPLAIMLESFLLFIIGIFSGLVSGLIGIGGGLIIVPILIFLFDFSQHQAQGTTLAMLIPPIGFLAALSYYKHGYVDVKVAALLALGFIVGTLPGAKLAFLINDSTLRKIFGAGLLLTSIKMLLFP